MSTQGTLSGGTFRKAIVARELAEAPGVIAEILRNRYWSNGVC